MRLIRVSCILLCLCLLTACAPAAPRSAAADRLPVHVTYTPDPTLVPAELIEAIVAPAGTPAPGSGDDRIDDPALVFAP